VIAVDSNVLVYAHRRDSPLHEAARAWVTQLAQGRQPWAIPWPCVHEFLGVVTHGRIYSPPSTLAEAIDQIEAWMESPSLVMISESPDYWSELKAALLSSKVVGARVHDARIAALCLQHGVEALGSADRDFNRFPRLKVINPLVR
jgi:toxin-antitoxin system PIN domain toxin